MIILPRPLSSLTYLYGFLVVTQMPHRVEEHQTVGQLETGRQDMGEEGDTAHDPAPATVRVKVLQGEEREREEKKRPGQMCIKG